MNRALNPGRGIYLGSEVLLLGLGLVLEQLAWGNGLPKESVNIKNRVSD